MSTATGVKGGKPTARQLQILWFIAGYRREQGVAPTVREIADAMGIRSPNGVACHLKALARKGLLKRPERYRSRSWIPVPSAAGEGGCCPTCGRPRETNETEAAATE